MPILYVHFSLLCSLSQPVWGAWAAFTTIGVSPTSVLGLEKQCVNHQWTDDCLDSQNMTFFCAYSMHSRWYLSVGIQFLAERWVVVCNCEKPLVYTAGNMCFLTEQILFVSGWITMMGWSAVALTGMLYHYNVMHVHCFLLTSLSQLAYGLIVFIAFLLSNWLAHPLLTCQRCRERTLS